MTIKFTYTREIKMDVFCVNSFTCNNLGGNPAGVVLNAEQLTEAQMQRIAKKVGYAETAFVCVNQQANNPCDFNVRFFTPTNEVDFCGHATLAVFSLMFSKGFIQAKRYIQRTKAGDLAVNIESNGLVTMNQKLPQFLGLFSHQEIATVLGVEHNALASTNLPVEIISTGLADVIIPVPLGMLDTIKPNDDQISHFCRQHNVVGFHLFELMTSESEYSASCRNFAPLVGIPEESATGSACGALACYLSKHIPSQINASPYRYNFEQGRVMNCSSNLSAKVRYTGDEISSVQVSGYAKLMSTQVVSV